MKQHRHGTPVWGGVLTFLIAGALPVTAMASKYDYEGYQVESNVVAGEPSKMGPPWQHRPTFRVPGTQTDVALGGYLKLDLIYDFDSDLGFISNGPNLLNPDNDTDGNFKAHALESRFNFRTHTPTEFGKLTTFLEGDFMGRPGPNQSATATLFRLRHAYASLGGWLFGQTWTNAMTFTGSARVVKSGSPNGGIFDRVAQVRYTHPLGGKSLFAVSLEDTSPQVRGADLDKPLPDLTVRYRYQRMFELSAITRQIELESGTDDDSLTSWGVQADLAYPIFGNATFKARILHGEAISDLISPRLRDAEVVNGELEAIDHTSGYVALENRWSPKWMTTLVYGMIDRSNASVGDVETMNYAQFDVFYDLLPRVSFGLGYIYFDIDDNVAGNQNDASRINGMVKVHF